MKEKALRENEIEYSDCSAWCYKFSKIIKVDIVNSWKHYDEEAANERELL